MSEVIDEARLEEIAGKAVGDVASALSIFMAYLGDQAGIFDTLDRMGRVTLDGLAQETGLIPTCIDHDPRAHLRRPMVMMCHG